jgi:hypothetical protein
MEKEEKINTNEESEDLEIGQDLEEIDQDLEEIDQDLEEIDETDEQPLGEDEKSIILLNQKIDNLSQNIQDSKFARVESKPEFASEVINLKNNQKVANLKENEIVELLEKRRFVNLLNNFGWVRLAKRILDNVQDVENYSLSEGGMLIKHVMTEQAKTAQYSYENNLKKGGKIKNESF